MSSPFFDKFGQILEADVVPLMDAWMWCEYADSLDWQTWMDLFGPYSQSGKASDEFPDACCKFIPGQLEWRCVQWLCNSCFAVKCFVRLKGDRQTARYWKDYYGCVASLGAIRIPKAVGVDDPDLYFAQLRELAITWMVLEGPLS